MTSSVLRNSKGYTLRVVQRAVTCSGARCHVRHAQSSGCHAGCNNGQAGDQGDWEKLSSLTSALNDLLTPGDDPFARLDDYPYSDEYLEFVRAKLPFSRVVKRR